MAGTSGSNGKRLAGLSRLAWRVGGVVLLAVTLAGCLTANGNPDKAAYIAGRRALEENRNTDAAKTYATINPNGGAYSEPALLDSGYAALRRGDPVAAKVLADRYIALYPQSPNLSYAIVLQATAHYAILRDAPKPAASEIDATIADLNHVKDAYPKVAPPDVIDQMIAELQARKK